MKVNCKNCEIEFDKSQSEIKKTVNHFCSRSCSAKYTNKTHIKRKKTNKCLQCGELIKARTKRCKNCRTNEDCTFKELKCNSAYRASIYAKIRGRARTIAKNLGWKCCAKCGYDKHIEIAHIKPISQYHDDDKVSLINNISNLTPLCPNCHWEHDNLSTG